MPVGYLVRPYRSGDEEGIVSLLIHGFKGWPHFDLECSPLDHWKWKFLENPFRSSIIFVVEHDDQIIGCTHSLYSMIKIGDRVLLCSPGADSAVNEGFRNLGLLSELHKQKNEQYIEKLVGISYGTSNNKYVQKVWRREGREPFPHPLVHLIKIRDMNLFLSSLQGQGQLRRQAIRLAIRLSLLENRLLWGPVPSNQGDPGIEVVDSHRFDERVSQFWSWVKGCYSFITERSTEYLNWRYCDPRGGGYRVKTAVEGGQLVGYVVLRVNRYDKAHPQGYIVDLCTRSDRLDCVEALVHGGMKYFNDAGVNVVNYCGVKSHPFIGVLSHFGFIDSRQDVVATYNRIGIGASDDALGRSSPKEILFQYGDFDWI